MQQLVIQIDKNGNAYGSPMVAANLCTIFPAVSFPSYLTPDCVESYGYGCYQLVPSPECDSNHKCVEISPQRGEDGIYYQSYKIVELTESELAARTETQWMHIRNQRDFDLLRCDWTVGNDSPLSDEKKVQWASYRQALRDITTQTDPFNITWPTKPE